MSAIAEPEMKQSTAAKSRGASFFALAGLTVAVHLAALAVLFATEYGPFAITLSVLAWIFMNCFLLAVLRRPGVCAALALALTVILITLSHFKFGILQLTLTFLDFLIIDRDTFSFLLSVFPRLQMQLIAAGLVAAPVLWALWRFDPFRVRRRVALGGVAATAALIAAMAVASPEQAWEPFQGVNHISNLARSGVVAVSRLASTGWIEADPPAEGPLHLAAAHAALPLMRASVAPTACDAPAKRPHIIMLLDESSFDVTSAPDIKVPAGYKDFFKSSDGKQRTMIAESTGGPTWYTEYNVLTGLSARSFGDLKFYVTRIAAGRVTRGLPQALQRCGYKTVSLYPTYGDFLGARTFQKGTGVEQFIDMAAMGVNEDMQPDSFYYDQALKVFAREKASQSPVFMFVYLTANHFPWTDVYRPDLTPKDWTPPGNTAEVDEYIRRQTMTASDYREFTARLQRDYPDEFVPRAAFRRSPAGDLAKNARARDRPKTAGETPDGIGPALLLDLLCDRRHQLFTRQSVIGARNPRCRLSPAGAAGSRRPPARSDFCGAEEHHAPLQRRVLRLQERRGSAEVQPAADRCRDDQGACP